MYWKSNLTSTVLGVESLHFISIPQNLHHMYRAYGGWTFAFRDYLDLNVTMHLDDPRFEQMAAIIDPYGEWGDEYMTVLYLLAWN